MPKPVDSQILDQIVEQLGAIQTPEYSHDVEDVLRYSSEGAQPKYPGIVVIAGDRRKIGEDSGRVEWEMDVHLDCYVLHDPETDARTSDEVMSEFESDVHNAIMADRQLAGLATLAEVVSFAPLPVTANAGHEINVVIGLRVQFKHKVEDAREQF
ncbi:MAG TPA: hypothetical protein VEL28_21050 [Candidatus Binatia bacterium]|nr:hypothetical protein [Candidatus Binatia bacterium]